MSNEQLKKRSAADSALWNGDKEAGVTQQRKKNPVDKRKSQASHNGKQKEARTVSPAPSPALKRVTTEELWEELRRRET